jgi:hypothetical protein
MPSEIMHCIVTDGVHLQLPPGIFDGYASIYPELIVPERHGTARGYKSTPVSDLEALIRMGSDLSLRPHAFGPDKGLLDVREVPGPCATYNQIKCAWLHSG